MRGRHGEAAGEALQELGRRYPGVRDRILLEEVTVRPHVNVFVGTENIRETGGLATPLSDGAEIAILPAVSGGTEMLGGSGALYGLDGGGGFPKRMADGGRRTARKGGLENERRVGN